MKVNLVGIKHQRFLHALEMTEFDMNVASLDDTFRANLCNDLGIIDTLLLDSHNQSTYSAENKSYIVIPDDQQTPFARLLKKNTCEAYKYAIETCLDRFVEYSTHIEKEITAVQNLTKKIQSLDDLTAIYKLLKTNSIEPLENIFQKDLISGLNKSLKTQLQKSIKKISGYITFSTNEYGQLSSNHDSLSWIEKHHEKTKIYLHFTIFTNEFLITHLPEDLKEQKAFVIKHTPSWLKGLEKRHETARNDLFSTLRSKESNINKSNMISVGVFVREYNKNRENLLNIARQECATHRLTELNDIFTQATINIDTVAKAWGKSQDKDWNEPEYAFAPGSDLQNAFIEQYWNSKPPTTLKTVTLPVNATRCEQSSESFKANSHNIMSAMFELNDSRSRKVFANDEGIFIQAYFDVPFFSKRLHKQGINFSRVASKSEVKKLFDEAPDENKNSYKELSKFIQPENDSAIMSLNIVKCFKVA